MLTLDTHICTKRSSSCISASVYMQINYCVSGVVRRGSMESFLSLSTLRNLFIVIKARRSSRRCVGERTQCNKGRELIDAVMHMHIIRGPAGHDEWA